MYTIVGLANGDTVAIDGVTYTYADDKLTHDGTGYMLTTSGTIAFNIEGGTDQTTPDTVANNSAVTYLDTIAGAGKLKSAITAIGSDITTTFNFNASGVQVGSSGAYTLKQDSSGAYTLADASGANTGIVIDAGGVTGLTLTLSDTNGQDTVLFDATTVITNATFAAGDIISNSATVASATVKAKVKSGNTGTLSVSGGTVTLITGTFEGGADTAGVSVAADTTDVVIGNITFDATTSTQGTYTDATNVAISAGKVSVGVGETNAVNVTAGTTTYTTKESTATTISYANNKATLEAGTVSLDNGESIDVGTLGTITNNGNDALEVGDSTGTTVTLKGGESFTTTDASSGYTVKYTANSDATKITVAQTKNGSTVTRIYTATSGNAKVTLVADKGAFDDTKDTAAGDSGYELSGVTSFEAVALKPIAELTGTTYYHADGNGGFDGYQQRYYRQWRCHPQDSHGYRRGGFHRPHRFDGSQCQGHGQRQQCNLPVEQLDGFRHFLCREQQCHHGYGQQWRQGRLGFGDNFRCGGQGRHERGGWIGHRHIHC